MDLWNLKPSHPQSNQCDFRDGMFLLFPHVVFTTWRPQDTMKWIMVFNSHPKSKQARTLTSRMDLPLPGFGRTKWHFYIQCMRPRVNAMCRCGLSSDELNHGWWIFAIGKVTNSIWWNVLVQPISKKTFNQLLRSICQRFRVNSSSA